MTGPARLSRGGNRRAAWIIGVVVVVVVAMLVAVGVFGDRAVLVAGSPEGVAPPTAEGQAPTIGEPVGEEMGWSTVPHDQPAPVPGYNWQGWAERPEGRCAWVPPDLFASLSTKPVRIGGHSCHVLLAGGDQLQITWGGIYGPFLYDPIAFSEPHTVAGLEARVYDLAANQRAYPDSCQVQVNTRSFATLTVLTWHPDARPGDRDARCQVAKEAAELIVGRLVPAAGCLYDQRGKRIAALVTGGPGEGLASLAPPEGAETASRTLGVLPARVETTGMTCAVAVEFVRGRVLRTQYGDDTGEFACAAAESLAGEAVIMLLNATV